MRWAAGIIVVVLAALGAVDLYTSASEGKPRAADVRAAAERVFADRCTSQISARQITTLGGGDMLPSGMQRAHQIVCDADVAASEGSDDVPSLALHFVFSTDTAARRFMGGGDSRQAGGYQDGDWWLRDGTLIAAGGWISHREWLRLREALALR